MQSPRKSGESVCITKKINKMQSNTKLKDLRLGSIHIDQGWLGCRTMESAVASNSHTLSYEDKDLDPNGRVSCSG